MPSLARSQIPPWPKELPVADIPEVDLDALEQGDKTQAQAVLDACQGYGFFYVKNHHVDSDFMFDLADNVFQLPMKEKMKYDMGTTGNYFGYKASGAQYIDEKGTRDQSQFYNVSKDDILRVGDKPPLEHPQPIVDRRQDLEKFMRACHRVVIVLLSVLEERLDLPKDTLTNLHRIDGPGGDQSRVTHAPPVEANVITLGEHTDFGSVTVLFNHLGGLQVLVPGTKDFIHVHPAPDKAIINLGDAIVKLVGGRLYSGVHRVMGAPGEQAQRERHSVVYFSRPNGDVKLRSLFSEDGENAKDAMNADEWIKNRVALRSTANYKGEETFKASRGTEHHTNGN